MQIHERKMMENKLWKKIILKDNIATKYIEYKHKNTGASSSKSIRIAKLIFNLLLIFMCFNSSTKLVSLKPSFGLSVEIWSQFSRLYCFDGVRNKVFTSLILEKNLWIHGKLDGLTHEKNILSEVKTPKYTVYKKR